MLAAGFDRGGEFQHLVIADAFRRLDRGEGRLAEGEGAGLVDDDGVDGGEALQRRGIAHQHAGLRAAPGGDHDRDRRGKAERARAGDDQHGHGRHQRISELRRRSEYQPSEEGDHRDGDHRWHEIAGHGIGKRLDRRPRALCVGDHGDDLRERGLGAGAIDAHVEAAGAVQRAARHAVAGLLLHGHRLAGEERLIDGAASLDDGAVDRDLVAGPHAQDIADLDRGELHRLGLAVLQHAQRGLGRKVEQRANGAAGPLAGPELEHLAEQHQRDDDRGRLEIGGDQPVRVLHGCGEQPRR